MSMNVSPRQLECFLLVADRGSFTRAGVELTLAQSAVSLLIRELESRDLSAGSPAARRLFS